MGILLPQVFPSALLHLDQPGVSGSDLHGKLDHGGCWVQPGDPDTPLSQLGKQRTASTADVQHVPGPESDNLIDRQPEAVEYRSPTEYPGNRLAAVEASEPAGPPVKIAIKISD